MISSAGINRASLFRVGKGLLAILFVWLAAQYVFEDREVLRQALAIKGVTLCYISLLLVLYFFLYSLRYVLLVEKHCKCRIPALKWFQMLVVLRFMNNIVPQMGTVYRGVKLKKEYGISYSDYIAATLFFIWSDSWFNFFLAGALLALSGVEGNLGGKVSETALLASGVGIFLLPFTATVLLKYFPALHRFRWSGKLLTIADEFHGAMTDMAYLIKFTGLGLASFFLMAIVFQLLLSTVGATASITTLAIFYALYRLTFHVSLTPGNVGIREVAYGILCQQAAIGMQQGVIVSAELRLFSMVTLALLAALVGSTQMVQAFRMRRDLQGGASQLG